MYTFSGTEATPLALLVTLGVFVSRVLEVPSLPHVLGTGHFLTQWPRAEALGASLVAQWLRILLPMQGTRV